jgi:hypothetical protein
MASVWFQVLGRWRQATHVLQTLVSHPSRTRMLGKVVRVNGHVFRDGQPIIEVVSSFLYRGRFDDYVNTFETVDEPDYVF